MWQSSVYTVFHYSSACVVHEFGNGFLQIGLNCMHPFLVEHMSTVQSCYKVFGSNVRCS